MGGGKGLTEDAAVEFIHVFVTEIPRPRIAGLINRQSMGEEFLNPLLIGDEGNGNLLDNIQLRGEEEDQDFTYLPQGIKPLLKRGFIEPDPDVIPLSYMPVSLDVIGVHMDSALEDGLHILLELFPGDIDQNGQGGARPFFDIAYVRPDDLYLLMLNFIQALQCHQLKLVTNFWAPKLHLYILFPDGLALILRPHIYMKLTHLLIPPFSKFRLQSSSPCHCEERDSSPVIARDKVPKQSLDRLGTSSAISSQDVIDCFASLAMMSYILQLASGLKRTVAHPPSGPPPGHPSTPSTSRR
ncbi:MAG: hypothetical protein DDT26_02517 [Dehalococcoidia bacterium]|nr:hypothetical protein [Chloroflexota bacterium]